VPVPRIARDLDAICLRALRKEPGRRYRSVEEFSEDIRRFLAAMPVIARGDQFSYRAGKFLRRHRIEVAAAVLLVISLAGGLAFTLREARLAEAQRARAERHFASVRELADVFMFDIHDAIKDLPGSTDARQLLVKNSLRYLNTLAAEAGDDVEMRKELAAAYEKVADIQGQAYGNANTGQQREALTSYAQAIALLEPVVAAHPGDTVVRTSLARNYLRQSRLLLLVGDSKDAVAASGRAVAGFEALASEHPDKDTRLRVAEAYSAHAYTMDMGAGQDDVGIAFAKKSAGILEELTRQHPDDQAIAYKLATAYGTLAVTVLGEKPDRATLEQSLSFHRKALAVDEKLVAATSGGNARYSRALLQDRYNIAFVLYELGDYKGAVENGRAGEPILAKMLADANNAQARVEGANLAWPLGRSLLALGQVDEAAAIFEKNVKVLEDLVRDSDTLKVRYLLGCMSFGLAEVHARNKEWRRAQDWYGKAVPHFERVTAGVKLDHMDQRPVDEAIAGLARAKAELTAN
jgi:non-specific serine/threonine protein kinase/serine/threonine-protein kinase